MKRQGRLGGVVLWTMRLGIMAMLAVGLAVLYHRYHLSPEQEELLRYVEIEVAALRQVEEPIEQRLAALWTDRHLQPEAARRQLVDELIPQLVRLRGLGEAPLKNAQTEPVRALAREYQATVEQLIDACRTAVRAIDDDKLGAQRGMILVGKALGAAAEKSRAWQEHVKAESDRLRLSKRR